MANTVRPLRPYAIALITTAGLAWLIAFMLWNVLGQVTDYSTYDLDTAAALTTWTFILVVSGVAALVGAAVITRTTRHIPR
jgi:hypothetical protein